MDENREPRNEYGENGDYRPESAEKQETAASPNTYGAVYTPSGTVDGEYHFTPYTRTSVQPEAKPAASAGNAAAPARSTKKKSRVGTVIAVCAAIVVTVAILAAIAVGGAYAFSRIFAGKNTQEHVQAGEPTVLQPDPQETADLSNTSVTVSDGGQDSSSILVRTVAQGEKMALEDAVAAVKDSVVEITTEVVKSSYFYGNYVTGGAGSGVIISADGYIITNHHVIDGASKIVVRLSDGTELDAKLISTDEETDVAVIFVSPGEHTLTAAVLGNSDSLLCGQTVFVIGNPLGELGGSVSAGIISATKREIAVSEVGSMTLIQTDAAVNPGNSGGGLFNLYGELVGIINAKYSDTGVEGLGFAIPVNDGWKVANDLLQYGYVKGRVVHGLKGITVAEQKYSDFFSSGTRVVITAVESGSELKTGDVIVGVNGHEVSSVADIKKVLRQCASGDMVTINYQRSVTRGSYTQVYSGQCKVEVYEVEQTGSN